MFNLNSINIYNEINSDKVDLKELENLLTFALNKEDVQNASVNVILVDNDMIRKINREYREKDYATDVISFALEEGLEFPNGGIRILGDIYISVEKAEEQGNLYEHGFRREISFLAIHGLLHLLGYNHETEEEEEVMFGRQELILNEYGIKR